MDKVDQMESLDKVADLDKKDVRSLTSFLVWSVFFGAFGVHNFYAGNIGRGILSVVFCWTGIPAILGYVTCLLVSKMNIEDINIKYKSVLFTDCDKGGRKAFFIVSMLFVIVMALSILSLIAMFFFMATAVTDIDYTW